MKALLNRSFLLLLAGLLLTGSVSAGVQQPTGNSPEATVSLRQRVAQVTNYLTYALQLSGKQQAAVRRCVHEELRQLDSLAQAPVAVVASTPETTLPVQPSMLRIVQRYEAAMAAVLTPGQYNAFTWLQERQPLAKR